MTATQWSRVTGLFARALELEDRERSRFLECEEPDVRREVERLLEEHRRTGGILDEPLFRPGVRIEEDVRTGQLLQDRYRIESFLARGGAGTVYRARDEQLAGRLVIVKFLHTWARQYPWLKHKFRQEMEALARIEHHGVVGVLDAGETADGLPFLVMEFIGGVTLRSEIDKGPLEIQRVSRLIRQTGRAVAAAHEKGVLHRDLKPENIMLEHAGTLEETVRLIDFGIARVDNGDQETVTRLTQFAGTTLYMSPEQLAGRPQPASDIYAIGVLAYEMLTGRRPFLAASPVELYEQQQGVRTDPRVDRPQIPRPAARAILKQLSFSPKDRSATALEAGEQIADALVGPARETWPRRRAAGVLLGGAGILVTGLASWKRIAEKPLDPSESVIELPMGTEPLERGFIKDLSIDYHVLADAEATGIDSMRISTTADQGGYFHPFRAAQSRDAYRRGWKMILEAAVEEGGVYALVDNPLDPRRYVLDFMRNPDGTETVLCLLGMTPEYRGLDWTLPAPVGARHHFELSWRPDPGEAELWVDGVKRISGYRGVSDFRYARGLQFGAGRYRSRRASGVIWKIRLEFA